MWIKRLQWLLAVLACMASISQAYAVVDAACPDIGNKGMQESDHHSVTQMTRAVDDASMHAHHAEHQPAATQTMSNCCDNHQCSSQDCASVHSASAAAITNPAAPNFNLSQASPTDYSAANLMTRANTLFRPPISR